MLTTALQTLHHQGGEHFQRLCTGAPGGTLSGWKSTQRCMHKIAPHDVGWQQGKKVPAHCSVRTSRHSGTDLALTFVMVTFVIALAAALSVLQTTDQLIPLSFPTPIDHNGATHYSLL